MASERLVKSLRMQIAQLQAAIVDRNESQQEPIFPPGATRKAALERLQQRDEAPRG